MRSQSDDKTRIATRRASCRCVTPQRSQTLHIGLRMLHFSTPSPLHGSTKSICIQGSRISNQYRLMFSVDGLALTGRSRSTICDKPATLAQRSTLRWSQWFKTWEPSAAQVLLPFARAATRSQAEPAVVHAELLQDHCVARPKFHPNGDRCVRARLGVRGGRGLDRQGPHLAAVAPFWAPVKACMAASSAWPSSNNFSPADAFRHPCRVQRSCRVCSTNMALLPRC